MFAHRYLQRLDKRSFAALKRLTWKVSRAGFARARECEPRSDAERFWKLVYGRQCAWGGKSNMSGFSTIHEGQTYNIDELWRFRDRLQGARLVTKDWKETLAECDGAGALFFIDPPYVEEWDMENGIPPEDIAAGVAKLRRKVRWYSWTALVLSLAALVAGFVEKAGFALTLIATIDVAAYLVAYFIRLRFMSRLAKSDDQEAKVRYFVEEQMTATPALVLVLVVLALIGEGRILADVHAGFTSFFHSGVAWEGILTGLLSQGTGVFGGLILLDKRENTFCVPVNRASSVLAGVVASYSLMLFLGTKAPGTGEMIGAGLIVAAIVVLAAPSLRKARS